MKFRTLACSAAMIVVAAVAAKASENTLPNAIQSILDNAEDFELLSLNPSEDVDAGEDGFHGWQVLGKTAVKDAKTRATLVKALGDGVKENTGIVAACFNPRHGIRATHDGKTVDLVICFECFSLKIYLGGERATTLVTKSPQPAFDKVLNEAKVPLPPKAVKD